MDFPIVEVPLIGGRMLIALVGVIHVLISHGCAVGGSFFLVPLERKSIQENSEGLNEAAYRLARWFFILTTSVGAMTGVGIWFTTNMFSPEGIGSLLRIFFWVWFAEWIVFVTEIALVSIYYLSWKRMSRENHLKVGIAYMVTSFLTMVVIVGILGFQLTAGRWVDTKSFWDAYFNPTYFPQLVSRIGLAGLLAAVISLFIFAFMRGFEDVREKVFRFTGAYLMIVSPIYLIGTYLYYQALPDRAAKFIPVALVTLQLTEYAHLSKIFFFVVVGVVFLTGIVLFTIRKTYGVFAVLPLLLMILATAQFSRVREFARKPYVINQYMYSNGIREAEAPFLSEVGVSRYATRAWRGLDPKDGESALGNMLFRMQCSVCHTYHGINGVFNRRAILASEESALNFLDSYQYSHSYMPPFVGTQEEKEALAKFLAEGAAKQ